MQEKAPDELARLKRHRLPPAWPIDAIVFPAERDAGVVGCDEAAIGDGDTAGVTGQIGQHLLLSRPQAATEELPADCCCEFGVGLVLADQGGSLSHQPSLFYVVRAFGTTLDKQSRRTRSSQGQHHQSSETTPIFGSSSYPSRPLQKYKIAPYRVL